MKSIVWSGAACAALVLVVSQTNLVHAATQSPAKATSAAPSACAGRDHCIDTASFAATVTDFQILIQNGLRRTLTARVTFKNKLARPLVLGYARDSGVATDERGNVYKVQDTGTSVQGIGEIVGREVDARFALQPNEESDARFEFVWNTSGQEIAGVSYRIDLGVREVETLPSGQLRLGREYALHFTKLDRTTPDAPPGRAVTSAAPAAALPDPCAGRARCYYAGPFSAELLRLDASFSRTRAVHILQASVRFRNLTNQPLILGYAAGTAVAIDENGNRYRVQINNRGDGAAGIGTVTRAQADTQFVLAPGAEANATFAVSRSVRATSASRTEATIGTAFKFEASIAQLEVLAAEQVRTVREYPVAFANLSTDGR